MRFCLFVLVALASSSAFAESISVSAYLDSTFGALEKAIPTGKSSTLQIVNEATDEILATQDGDQPTCRKVIHTENHTDVTASGPKFQLKGVLPPDATNEIRVELITHRFPFGATTVLSKFKTDGTKIWDAGGEWQDCTLDSDDRGIQCWMARGEPFFGLRLVP